MLTMIYINPRPTLSGFFLILILSVTALVISTMVLEPRKLSCLECARDAIGELSTSINRAKLGILADEVRICMDTGQSLNSNDLVTVTSLASLNFTCDSSVCAGGGLRISDSGISAEKNVMFKAKAECSGVSGAYSCTLVILGF